MLACPACRKLVHTDRLKALAVEAETAEREGRLSDALGCWRSALELLPTESAQHRAVADTVRRLSEAIDRAEHAKAAPPLSGGKVLAGLGAAGLVLWKLKYVVLSLLGKAKLLATGLTSVPTLLSMFAWLALDRSQGVGFALGLLASIYVHEMGHVYALRLYGIKATAPMFVPGLGALVRLHQYPIDARENARVGLAGPIWGCAAAAAALAPGLFFEQRTLLAIASIGATINVFNLIPLFQLDGARGFHALDVRQRGVIAAIAAVAALVLDQSMGLAVCAVSGIRIKSRLPERGDPRAFRTFAALLSVLSFIAWLGSPRG
jgi:Zn-dependent protease